ncbi:spiro-SPASM protein [Treponema vincentii]|uniref:spiro-SPASM protein n=1 Tax=Treponema vincentii TaxID=69710 RepID=UPI0020A2ADC9|nr:spiro-SPASM protein [Treponema vincentii]UTC48495.1 spiro-SPASM protein [Treponema vincentii]
MKSFVVLAANGISDYAMQPLTEGGYTALASALERTSRFPDYAGTIITAEAERCTEIQKYCGEVRPAALPPVQVVPVAEHTAAAFFQALSPFAAEADHLFIAWADAPFLDSSGAAQLYAQHCTYKAEYSFADGYPEGLLPQIVAAGLVPILAALPFAAEVPLNRSFLFDTIKKDINSYDLETMIAPDDVRYLRLAFYTGDKASWLLCRHFAGITAENYAAHISERLEYLRTLPAYYGIEITAYHPLHSIYRPKLFPEHFDLSCCMDVEYAVRLIDAIAAFSESAVISLSLYGEPLLHPHFAAIAAQILNHRNLSVLIETSGITEQPADTEQAVDNAPYFDRLAQVCRNAPPRSNGHLPVYWIVDVDAAGSKTYGAVHQLSDEDAERCLKQAVTFADRLAQVFPKAVWVQMTRMNENEVELEPFYRLWEKREAKPLIQKYDHLCGALPDRRPADIAPLHRHPCWHLKRDMSICTDGTVPLCKEDYNRSVVLGNAFTMPLETIWQNGQDFYREQIQSCYKGVCEHCDEYYTYNF